MRFVILLAIIFAVKCSVDVEKYLQQFGYHNPNSFDGGSLTESIKTFQRTFGLSPTGVADEQTTKLMNTPRCGFSDHHTKNAFSKDSKWMKKALTYYYYNYTPDFSTAQLKELVKEVFKYWSDVTPLQFTEVKKDGDIVLAFGRWKHKDDRKTCEYPFHGVGKTLAHAFLPPDGRLHFNDDETFTVRSKKGSNFLWVAVHELGHVLGLEHDTVYKEAIMYPYYVEYKPGMKLHFNDKYRIQRLYGDKNGRPIPSRAPPTPTSKPTQPACFDEASNCDDYLKFCKNASGYWKQFVSRFCQKSCNFC